MATIEARIIVIVPTHIIVMAATLSFLEGDETNVQPIPNRKVNPPMAKAKSTTVIVIGFLIT
jgi:hypothetical protein